ncbi:MAG: Crp/Fnr family transcriptional regulator [Dehalococcoidia bacterium]|nr:MAG: Crp/Fnr family transcriptional regulator [Dehalococcoidia bacterium]
MAIDVELLKSIPYFSGLSPAELDSIKEFIFERTAESGDLILLEGEPADAMYFVASGVVKTFKTSADGKEQILSFVRPGEAFNDVPVFDGGPNPASVQAIGPVVLYGIRNSDLEVILRDHPQVSLNVTRVLSQQVRHLVSLVEDLSFRHVIARVAKILLEHASDGTGPRPKLTQQEMAAMAGTAREMVGRSLKSLEDEGAIRL